MSAHASTAQSDRDEVSDQTDYAELVILSHPKPLSVNETDSFSLNVIASSERPLRYQWYKNEQAIIGAVYASYSKAKSAVGDQGIYHVVVSSEFTSQRSLSANINIKPKTSPLRIVQAPQGQSVSAGDSFFLYVVAEGEGTLSYRWQKNGSIIPNATSPYYLVSTSQKSDQGSYRVIVSNNTSTVYSSFVNIWVTDAIEPLSISTQPVSQTILENASTELSVSASGGGYITYQWRKNGLPITNAYSPTLKLSNVSQTDAGSYDVVIANSQGSLVSNSAQLNVLPAEPALMISQQPLSQNIQIGESFALNVGTVSDTQVDFQWFLNGEAIAGANSAIYWVEQAGYSSLGSYSVLISNSTTELRSDNARIDLYQAESYAIELSWDTPRAREDGSPLEASEILGYIIEYGYEPELLKKRLEVSHQAVNSFILDGIDPGTLFLRIATVDIDGNQGSFSEAISLSID